MTKFMMLQKVVGLFIVGGSILESAEASKSCERLKATLTYTQEDAPRDLSSVLPVVVERINRLLDGVVDVEVEWNGSDLHGKVGEHIVECTVTRLASAITSTGDSVKQTTVDEEGREIASQCFYVPFTILDTNECSLPRGHPMRHACPAPSICINTSGSYECLCPRLGGNPSSTAVPTTADESFWKDIGKEDRSAWEVSFSSPSKTSCPSAASTHDCCPPTYTAEGKKCRERFHCPVDPCQPNNSNNSNRDTTVCAPNAQCTRAASPLAVPNHSCECPDGLMGNGLVCRPGDPDPQPKVMFDGITPTELTIKNNFYCGCHKPAIDACSGFPPCKGKHEICTVSATNKPMCACRPGYVHHEKYGCVDVNPPTLELRNDPLGDKVLRLKQGDDYREYMVDIVDENAEDYLRNLKITYSRPLPPGCLTSVGEFHVNYTVAMPWANPPYVRVTRRVVIDDIDECSLDVTKYKQICPELIPQCDVAAGAQCHNTVGSYKCLCPAHTSGDGFLKSASFSESYPPPLSYGGGTGCVDTSKPVITLQGPNPKVFKVCSCGGLDGVMGPSKNNVDEDKGLQSDQRKLYEADIRRMIQATSAAELCATHDNPRPSPSDCVVAVDHTYKGDIDLSNRVTVGEPIQKSHLHWVVPYDVKDDAGNQASTVYRDVVVTEVDLATVEKKIRDEVTKEQQQQTQRAIDRAIKAEKQKWERESRAASNRSRRTGTGNAAADACPACPACDCPDMAPADAASCHSYCNNLSASCKLSDENMLYFLLFWLESVFPARSIPTIILTCIAAGLVLFLRLLFFIFNPRAYTNYDYGHYTAVNDETILATHPAYRPPISPIPGTDASTDLRPPTASLSNRNTNGTLLSPSNYMGSPMPRTNQHGNMEYVSTPGSNRRDVRVRFDNDGNFHSPGIIVPSQNGKGAHSMSPYG